MKRPAKIAIFAFTAVLMSTAALAFSNNAWAAAGSGQVCETGTSCVVGEFLYDDSYVPITSATCTITSKYPDGTAHLTAQSMTSAADGFYSHSFTPSSTTGIYRAQVCCTSGADYMCLDKSFQVNSPAATAGNVAAAVWGSARASYTASGTFGEALQSIIPASSDIASATWSYSDRSLSTFGDLVSNVWSNTVRTVTGGTVTTTTTASSADIAEIAKTTKETRLLLEKLVNKPIVETTTEEVPDLGNKLSQTEGAANQLFISTQFIKSEVDLMNLKWSDYDGADIAGIVSDLNKKLGTEKDPASSDSVFGTVQFFSDSWDWTLTATAKTRTLAVKSSLDALQKEVNSSRGKSKQATVLANQIAVRLKSLESVVGDSSNDLRDKTMFGKLAETKALSLKLEQRSDQARSILKKWGSLKDEEKTAQLTDLSRKMMEVNKISGVNRTLLSLEATSDKELKNRNYYVLGVVSANKKLLASKSGTTVLNTWLELGSIVFKSLATNPSSLISQDVVVNYYLPPEVSKENILEVDQGLSVKFDADKNQYYVTGTLSLLPNESKTVSVRMNDVWEINEDKVKSLRTQAAELSRPLEKTSYFAQGVTLKTDIDVSLDRVLEMAKENGTPEEKIKAYREAEIELSAVSEKMSKLKDLVSEAGSVGTLSGFVGGGQLIAVWGLVLVLCLGFVFLAIYMKFLTTKGAHVTAGSQLPEDLPVASAPKVSKISTKHALTMTVILAVGIAVGLFGGIVVSSRLSGPGQVVASGSSNNQTK